MSIHNRSLQNRQAGIDGEILASSAQGIGSSLRGQKALLEACIVPFRSIWVFPIGSFARSGLVGSATFV